MYGHRNERSTIVQPVYISKPLLHFTLKKRCRETVKMRFFLEIDKLRVVDKNPSIEKFPSK